MSNGSMAGLDDQASRLRALMRETGSRAHRMVAPIEMKPAAPRARWPRVLTVASGKGGVGKTNVCVNLAIASAARGVRTVLIDGDLGLANADVLCGVNSAVHVGQVIDGDRTLQEIALEGPGGFRLVPGGAGVTRLSHLDPDRRDRLIESFSSLADAADLVIVDCGAGVGDGVVSFIRASDLTLIVTTPEPTAIADAYALIKVLATGPGAAESPRTQLLVNQAKNRAEAEGVHRRVAAVSARFLQRDAPFAGWVRADQSVPASVRARRPLLLHAPGSRAAKDVRNLSGSILAELGMDCAARGKGGGLRRLCGRAARGFGQSPLGG